MKKPMSFFFSISLTTILPFTIVFSLIIISVGALFNNYNSERAKETVEFSARYISDKITDSLNGIANLVALASMNMAAVAGNSPRGRDALEKTLYSLMESNHEINCAWYVFDEGFASSQKGWYARSFMRKESGITEIPAVSNEDLNDPEISAWHIRPFNSGQLYHNPGNYWDYGIGEAPEFIASLAMPVIRDGKIIGTVGMDITYEKAFKFLDEMQESKQYRLLLLSESSQVIYVLNGQGVGRKFQELGFTSGDQWDIASALESGRSLVKTIDSPFFNEKSLLYLTRISLPGTATKLYLLIDAPNSFLYQDERSIIKMVSFVYISTLFILSAVIILLTRKLVIPIRNITEYATLIANGQLDIDSKELNEGGVTNSEVESLRTSILKMLQQLNQNHELKMYAMETKLKNEKLEETSRARSQFFAKVSHEIRTPMNAIIGISDILLKKDNLDEGTSKHVSDINTSAVSLLEIINDILDMSKFESGKLTLTPVDYDFPLFLNNIRSIGENLANERGLSFVYDEGNDLPRCLFGDDLRLRQVLTNVISNAVKYTVKGEITLITTVDDDNIIFTVKDTGIGIKPDDIQYIFEPFKQVDITRNRSIQGAGLGLSICKNLVELMGGNIDVNSVYGVGSAFTLKVPKVQGNEEALEKRNLDHLSGQIVHFTAPDLRVLVIDDIRTNLVVAQGFLSRYGIQPDICLSGSEGVELVTSNEYDIVFLDHMMPVMDGIEVARIIRSLKGERFRKLPLIALTANAIFGMREMFLNNGFNDFLAKPLEMNKLNKILEKWVPMEKRVKSDLNIGAADSKGTFFPEIEGIDIKAGITLTGGTEEGYIKVLELFRNDVVERLEYLKGFKELILESRPGESSMSFFITQVHALKSASASIGANEISRAAEFLEFVGKSDDIESINSRLGDFCYNLSLLAERIKAATLSASSGKAKDWNNMAIDREKLRRLKDALASEDIGAADNILAELLGMPSDSQTSELLSKISDQILTSDFSEAEAELDILLAATALTIENQ